MKRIDLTALYPGDDVYLIAKGINEIMDYLEKNLPTKSYNFYRCTNCGTGIYTATEPFCTCHSPDFEVINGT